MNDHQLKQTVRERYGAVAAGTLSSEHKGAHSVATSFGYSPAELASIPAEANMGLSCGNPTAMASLRPGEVVLDLGCGGGLDVLLAAQKVGPTGRAIGVDMTPEMLARARRNAAQQGLQNVEFHHAEIEQLPLPDNFVDCVISNCVLNLVPDKVRAFREIWRVLKPGGRLAASDIALKQPLPREIGTDVLAYVGCVAGAILIEDYRRALQAAGFTQVELIDSRSDLGAYAALADAPCGAGAATSSSELQLSVVANSCCAAPMPRGADDDLPRRLAELAARYDINQYAASVKVFATKPLQ